MEERRTIYFNQPPVPVKRETVAKPAAKADTSVEDMLSEYLNGGEDVYE
jgi:hypothetical protein